MQWGLFMFRHSLGQRSGTRIVSVFSSEDFIVPDVIQTYSFTGANQDILVPAGYNSCEYIIWGAAGSRATNITPLRGGAGGATTGILAVTGGESLIAIVGQGGLSTTASIQSRAGGYGGSGSCSGDGSFFSGRGGGRSAIRRSSTELATAGGGGGASYNTGSEGGVGGGATGGSAGSTGTSGGGTQSAGGASGGGTAGSSLQGGNGVIYGGSGGGGLFGGGGGGNSTGGGGGSGFAGGTSALTYQGTGATPPLNADPRYPGGGVGTSNTNNDQAGHGFIHLRFFA